MKGLDLVGSVFAVSNSKHVITVTMFDAANQMYFIHLDTGWHWKWITQKQLQDAVNQSKIVRVYTLWKPSKCYFSAIQGEIGNLAQLSLHASC